VRTYDSRISQFLPLPPGTACVSLDPVYLQQSTMPDSFEIGKLAVSSGVDIEINGTMWWSQQTCDRMNKTDPRVHDDGFCCKWTSPYGFVPEAGCPLHD